MLLYKRRNKMNFETFQFECCVNTAQTPQKLVSENFPTLLGYSGKSKTAVFESDARFRTLSYGWFNVQTTLPELLNFITAENHSFLPSAFNINTSQKMKGILMDTDFYAKKQQDVNGDNYVKIITKNIADYNDLYDSSNHIWRCKKNFKQTNLLVIDIDEGYNSIQDVFDKLKELRLDCNFIYTSLSHNENNIKLRMGWILKEPLTNIKYTESLLSILINIFKADIKCCDASRLYFNGQEVIYTNYDYELKMDDLILNFGNFKIVQLHQKYNNSTLPLYNNTYKHSVVFDEKDQNCTIFNPVEYFKQYDIPYSIEDSHNGIRKFNFKDPRFLNIKLVNELINGWLEYNDLFFLLTNLCYIERGLKFAKTHMDKCGKYSQNAYNALSLQWKKYNYYPMTNESKLSEHLQEGKSFFEILSQQKLENTLNYIKVKIEPVLMSLDEATLKLKEAYNKIRYNTNPNDYGIYIIKCATGLGKTQLLEDNSTDLLCFPTHALKNEVHNRLESKNTPHIVIPKKPKLSQELQTHIDYYYSLGATEMVNNIFLNIYKHTHSKIPKKVVPSISYNDVLEITKYYSQIKVALESKDSVLTTHLYGINSYNSKDWVIFDEDPIFSLLYIDSIAYKDLLHIYERLTDSHSILKQAIERFIDIYKTHVPGHIHETPHISKMVVSNLIELLKDNQFVSANIINFLTSIYFYFCPKINGENLSEKQESFLNIKKNTEKFHFINRHEFPKNKNIIILSATVESDFYKQLYGDRVKEVIDISNVETVGIIEQDTTYTATRTSVQGKKFKEKTNTELANVDSNNIITFKNSKIDFNSLSDLHFGNNTGYDNLKGENIAVIGTQLFADWTYLLYAKALNYKYDNADLGYTTQKIEDNNFVYNFNSFTNTNLQKIQMCLIRSELIQSVGRSRALRMPTYTKIYSGVPLVESDIIHSNNNYFKGKEIQINTEIDCPNVFYNKKCITIPRNIINQKLNITDNIYDSNTIIYQQLSYLKSIGLEVKLFELSNNKYAIVSTILEPNTISDTIKHKDKFKIDYSDSNEIVIIVK